MAELAADVGDEVDRLTGLNLQRLEIQFHLTVMDGGASEQPRSATDYERPYPFTLLGFMDQRRLHTDGHIAWRDPPPDRSMGLVVARMAACGGKLHPAELAIGISRSALPRRTCEVGQLFKFGDSLRLFIKFAIPILPGEGGCGNVVAAIALRGEFDQF